MAKERATAERWTESRVFTMLRGPFPDGAFIRIPHVTNGTGYQSTRRICDALIVSCWPSRGLWFSGVEIKVCPADWKRELAKPAKSDAIQQWCNYWYVACPVGVVPIGELPPTWGLIECTGRGCVITKPAPKLKPKPADVAFVCAVLRGAMSGMTPTPEVESLAQKRAEELAKSDNWNAQRLREKIAKFKQETGIDIEDTWRFGDVKRAVELVSRSGGNGLQSTAETLKNYAQLLVRTGQEVLMLCDQALASPEVAKTIGASTVDDHE
jgi:hypothetical protein